MKIDLANSSAQKEAAKNMMGIWSVLKLRYSIPRIQWLVVTMASLSILYLSSEEIWSTVGDIPHPHVTNETMVIYCTFFLLIAFLVHLNDIASVASKPYVIIIVAIASISVDVGFLCLSEIMTLLSIQVLPQSPLRIAELLLLGAMPGSLGVVTLSSLTTTTLRERASRLRHEVHELAKQAEELDRKTDLAKASLADFERKKREFMQRLSENNDKDPRVEPP